MSLTMLTLVVTVLMALVSSSFSYSDTYSNTPSYSYAYQILDTYSGQDFGHEEASKLGKVNGEYRVLLPDDRLQVVSYTADQNGYVADVQYADGSTSPAYGNGNANGYSGSGAASVKTSASFNPPTSNDGYQYAGRSTANGYGGGSYNNYQNGDLAGQGLYQQAFKSGCICQCPA